MTTGLKINIYKNVSDQPVPVVADPVRAGEAPLGAWLPPSAQVQPLPVVWRRGVGRGAVAVRASPHPSTRLPPQLHDLSLRRQQCMAQY